MSLLENSEVTFQQNFMRKPKKAKQCTVFSDIKKTLYSGISPLRHDAVRCLTDSSVQWFEHKSLKTVLAKDVRG